MKKARYMDTDEMVKCGVKALYRELGPVEAQRFISISSLTKKDSIKRHHEWQDAQDPDELFAKVAALHDGHRRSKEKGS